MLPVAEEDGETIGEAHHQHHARLVGDQRIAVADDASPLGAANAHDTRPVHLVRADDHRCAQAELGEEAAVILGDGGGIVADGVP